MKEFNKKELNGKIAYKLEYYFKKGKGILTSLIRA